MGEEDVAKVEATKPLEVGGSVFPESRREAGEVEGEAIVGVTGWVGLYAVVSAAVVVRTLPVVVDGFVVDGVIWGAGGKGGCMNWRLSGGRGSEALARL